MMIIHLGNPSPDSSVRSTRQPIRSRESNGQFEATLFDLAPCGVCPAFNVTIEAVRSYRTFSPLSTFKADGMFSVALSLGLLPVLVKNHTALRSSDFPLPALFLRAIIPPAPASLYPTTVGKNSQ